MTGFKVGDRIRTLDNKAVKDHGLKPNEYGKVVGLQLDGTVKYLSDKDMETGETMPWHAEPDMIELVEVGRKHFEEVYVTDLRPGDNEPWPYGENTWAVVDEAEGGIVAYTGTLERAITIRNALRNYVF